MQYIKRLMTDKLMDLSKKFPIIAITGPRQSGKTTLSKNTFPNYKYVSLEDPDIRDFANSDPRGFLAKYRGGVIIDEIQRVPELFSYLQTITDQSGIPGEYIITGSENLLLAQHLSQSLAGRAAYLKLLPFSLQELKQNIAVKGYEECLFRGFYPRIYDLNIAPSDWYPNYIDTYLERDVRQIKNITNLNLFRKFIRLCAANCGQIVNYTSLANDCGVTHNTIVSWLGVLETSYIIYLLKPHYNNYNKRIIKMPKLYFFDTGLACSLLGISSIDHLENYYQKGALFENMVISELIKSRLNLGLTDNLFYWRDKTGHEIDVILENSTQITPVEIKSSLTISKDFFKHLTYYCKLAEIELNKSVLIYGGSENSERSNGRVVGFADCSEINS